MGILLSSLLHGPLTAGATQGGRVQINFFTVCWSLQFMLSLTEGRKECVGAEKAGCATVHGKEEWEKMLTA